MDLVSEEYSFLSFHLLEPQIIPETHQPPPLSVQVELTLSLGCTCIRHDYRTGDFIDRTAEPAIPRETLRFDLDVLKNNNQVHQILAPALTRLELDQTPRFSVDLVNEIIKLGLKFGNNILDGKDKTLSLNASIQRTTRVFINNVEDLLTGALLESDEEFEACNYGMVPAKESSVKEMLTKVSVELGEKNCMICLEKLEVGSDAFRMPCSHTFHGDCIEKWLKQSHYCPICRFEMPS